MKTINSLVLIIAFCGMIPFASAQDMKPKKFDRAEWYQIVHVDYKNGMTSEARNIIDNYFKKAATIAQTSTPVMEFALSSGEYDYMYVWKLEEGLESLNWEMSPSDVKWWDAMVEVAGSEEKAKEFQKKYSETVARSKTELARKTN